MRGTGCLPVVSISMHPEEVKSNQFRLHAADGYVVPNNRFLQKEDRRCRGRERVAPQWSCGCERTN